MTKSDKAFSWITLDTFFKHPSMNHLSYIPYTPTELLLSQVPCFWKKLRPKWTKNHNSHQLFAKYQKWCQVFSPYTMKIAKLQKRDVMRNFWRDTICYFEWTRPLIGPRYRWQLLVEAIGGCYWGQPIRGLVHSKRQIMSLQKFCMTSLFCFWPNT